MQSPPQHITAQQRLDGRVALITGAGRGIGRQEARHLADQGACVVVNDAGVDPSGRGADTRIADAVVDEIIRTGGRAVANTDRVDDWDGAQRMVHTAVEAFGDLHVVINNAGTQVRRSLVDLTEDDVDDVLSAKLKGTSAVSHWAAVAWREAYRAGARTDRAIINTSSGSGLLNPLPLATAYAAANAGVGALTIVHALELAHYGVRVNAIAPSMARTRLTEDLADDAAPSDPASSDAGIDPWDPFHQAVVAGCLAAADCPLTGQVLTVQGNTVTVNRNWSPIDTATAAGPAWQPEELAEVWPSLPVEDQFDKLLAALQPVYGLSDVGQVRQLIADQLDGEDR